MLLLLGGQKFLARENGVLMVRLVATSLLVIYLPAAVTVHLLIICGYLRSLHYLKLLVLVTLLKLLGGLLLVVVQGSLGC